MADSQRFSRLDDASPSRAATVPTTGTTSRRSHWYELKPSITLGIVLAAFGIGTLAAILSSEPYVELCSWADPRLPSTAYTADSYKWTVTPSMQAPYPLKGHIEINLEMHQHTKCIVLNAHKLAFSPSDVKYEISGVDRSGKAEKISFSPNRGQAIIKFPVAIPSGKRLTISIDYTGNLNEDMKGLYVSKYENEKTSATETMVSTQFEATYARWAFPCLDEPDFKAEFDIAIDGVPQGYEALSNMPVQSIVPSSSGVGNLVKFVRTVRMSTYLVAVAVAKLEKKSQQIVLPISGDTVDVAVWAPADAGYTDFLDFPLSIASSIIPFYTEFYRVPYPLPKVDLIAIPSFAAGAMENWGLITFRLTALLANRNESSSTALGRVATVVSHELAHQWFGNLVTMEWWNQLWLNEGFASFMEYRGVDNAAPEFNVLKEFVVTDPMEALSIDSYAATHPLNRENVKTTQQIEEMFDSISYSKGAAIIAMTSAHVNAVRTESFNQGLQNYLSKYRYGNADSTMLWRSLSEASGLDELPQRLSLYTNEQGYSLVTAAWKTEDMASAGSGKLVLSQQRFLRCSYSRDRATEREGTSPDFTWWIPLTWVTNSTNGEKRLKPFTLNELAPTAPAFTQSLLPTEIDFDSESDGWIKFNANQTGYYRVVYPRNVYDRLATGIQYEQSSDDVNLIGRISADDRAGLLDDLVSTVIAYNGAQTGFTTGSAYLPGSSSGGAAAALDLDIVFTFEVLQKILKHESEYAPWVVGIRSLHKLSAHLPDDQCSADFNRKAVDTLSQIVTALGWGLDSMVTARDSTVSDASHQLKRKLSQRFANDDDPLLVKLRSAVLSAAARFNDTQVISEAQSLFERHQNGTETMPVNLRSIVYPIVVREGGQNAFDAVKAIYDTVTDPTEKVSALMALTSTRVPELLDQLLKDSLNTDKVASQETVSMIVNIASNPLGTDKAWEFITAPDNFRELMSRYGTGGFELSDLVFNTAAGFSTRSRFEDVKSFYEAHPVPAAELEIEQSLEAIQAHIEFVNVYSNSLCDYLRNN